MKSFHRQIFIICDSYCLVWNQPSLDDLPFGLQPGGVSQNLSSGTHDSFCYKLLKSLLLIGY